MSSPIIKIIANDLLISREFNESVRDYAERVLFSACSAWFNATVWEKDANPSVRHVKDRLRKRIAALIAVCPELSSVSEPAQEELIAQVYKLHCWAGTVYYANSHLVPAPEKIAKFGGVWFFHSGNPQGQCKYSGLGVLAEARFIDGEENLFDAPEAYMPKEAMKILLNNPKWASKTDLGEMMYLNVFRRPGESYYSTANRARSKHTLARQLTNGRPRYFLVKGDQYHEFEDWMIEETRFDRCIAMHIFAQHQPLIAEYYKGRYTVSIYLNYYLPLWDENFLHFWSWPKSFLFSDEPSIDKWNYTVPVEIYPTIQQRLMQLGYQMEERVYE